MEGLVKSDGNSFWQLPEGKTAKYLIIGALCVGGYFAITATAAVLALLASAVASITASLFTMGLCGAALALLFSPLYSDTAAALAKYIVRLPLRMIAGLVTTLDPIGIRENTLKDKLELQVKFRKTVGRVEKVRKFIADKIDSNAKAALKSEGIAKQAVIQQQRKAFNVNSKQNKRLVETNEEFTQALARLDGYLKQMYLWDEKVDEFILDLKNEIENEKSRLEVARELRSATSVIKRITQHSAEMDLSSLAALKIREEIDAAFGEVEQFRKQSEAMMESFSLEQGMMQAEMVQKLADAEANSGQQLRVAVSSVKLLPSSTKNEITDAEYTAVVGSAAQTGDIDALFSGKKR
ncbi:MAG: hypothetical protein RLZZ324_798 [Candidatus Parcubacteria bacterium]|jgi:hypothetical protein